MTSRSLPDEVLKAKLQAVMFESTSALPFLTPEDKDRLVKNAQLLDYLRIAPNEDPDLNKRLTKALGHPIGEGAATAAAPTVASVVGFTIMYSFSSIRLLSVTV